MKKYLNILLSCCLLIIGAGSMDAFAQRKTKKSAPKVSVDSLIKHYYFDQAIALLEEAIEEENAKKKKKKDTSLLEAKLQYARKANTMLHATEKVAFLDSQVVHRSQLFESLSIDKESGRIDRLFTLIPDLQRYNLKTGEATYMNELGDAAIFAVQENDSLQHLYMTERIGENWTKPQKNNGLIGNRQDYPFFLSDGVTLYYGAEGAEGLGGYDLYVSHFDPEKKSFRSSENLGMPFNSPDNDYLYIIDEVRNIGWLATDRRQAVDSVCIYTFIPTQTRETYNPVLVGEDALRNYAQILCLKDSQADIYTRTQTGQRIQKLSANNHAQHTSNTVYIVNDHIVYHHPALFRSDIARNYAMEWTKETEALNVDLRKLEEKRLQLSQERSTNPHLKEEILNLEACVKQRKALMDEIASKMRQAEIEYYQHE